MKRAFDILVSSVALLLLSPLLLPMVVVLRLTGEGEIFYRQLRVGRGKTPFMILKFATMLKNSPDLAGGDITIARDPRILPLGRFLRATKINELPQLLNIVLGDMSFIGWRPLTPRVADMFPDEYWHVVGALRPGLSGTGSIVFRDEEALLTGVTDRDIVYRSTIAPYKAALELWYAKRNSMWLDIKLMVLTVIVVVAPRFNIARWLRDLPDVPEGLRMLRSRAYAPFLRSRD